MERGSLAQVKLNVGPKFLKSSLTTEHWTLTAPSGESDTVIQMKTSITLRTNKNWNILLVEILFA